MPLLHGLDRSAREPLAHLAFSDQSNQVALGTGDHASTGHDKRALEHDDLWNCTVRIGKIPNVLDDRGVVPVVAHNQLIPGSTIAQELQTAVDIPVTAHANRAQLPLPGLSQPGNRELEAGQYLLELRIVAETARIPADVHQYELALLASDVDVALPGGLGQRRRP